MASFLKFNLTGAQEELLIPIGEIANVETVTTTTTKIDLANGLKKYTITHVAPLKANGVVKAIYAAMTANPGGVKSTVVSPLNTAQTTVINATYYHDDIISDGSAFALFGVNRIKRIPR